MYRKLWQMTLHIMAPGVRHVCRGRMHSRRWRSSSLRHALILALIAYRQNLFSSLKIKERHSTLQSTVSCHHSRRVWRFRRIKGNLCRGIHNLSPAVSRRFPIAPADTLSAHVSGFLPWMLFRRSPLLAHCVDFDVHLYYPALQNLVYGCGNVSETTAESSDPPPIHCTKHG